MMANRAEDCPRTLRENLANRTHEALKSLIRNKGLHLPLRRNRESIDDAEVVVVGVCKHERQRDSSENKREKQRAGGNAVIVLYYGRKKERKREGSSSLRGGRDTKTPLRRPSQQYRRNEDGRSGTAIWVTTTVGAVMAG